MAVRVFEATVRVEVHHEAGQTKRKSKFTKKQLAKYLNSIVHLDVDRDWDQRPPLDCQSVVGSVKIDWDTLNEGKETN